MWQEMKASRTGAVARPVLEDARNKKTGAVLPRRFQFARSLPQAVLIAPLFCSQLANLNRFFRLCLTHDVAIASSRQYGVR